MDSLIKAMNKLQDIFSSMGILNSVNLPQIVVLGSQSSGKSSVLESLVGKSFLPRGTGIVTRAPLILHLIYPTDSDVKNNALIGSKIWATFLHKPNVIYNDFSKVENEILRRTEELAGGKKNITEKPIILNIFSKFLYNLSFVDLPGLTKVPVDDQPKDIEIIIRKMVLNFIQNPNSIILAVVTANTDPATSESLHVAKTVDPNGDRTIAVVTKIDIMDAGTDASELLSGEVIPVKLGIIGVVNRSQKDINDNKTIQDSLIAEKLFFKKTYPTIAHQHGTTVLGKKLQSLLLIKIKNTCPGLKKQLCEINAQYNDQVNRLKEFTSNYDKSLLELITQTATSYKSCLDGQANCVSLKKLNGGANISCYFKTVFFKEIEKINPLHGLTDESITNVIQNSSGTKMGIFIPDQAFDHLVKHQLKQLEMPCLSCVGYVYEQLISIIYNIENEVFCELNKFPKLIEKICEVIEQLLNKYKSKTIKAVNKFIRYQESYMNTNHPDFIEAIVNSKEYNELFKNIITNESGEAIVSFLSSNEKDNSLEHTMRQNIDKISTCDFTGLYNIDNLINKSRVELFKLFIKCYFRVIKKIIQDTVPKIIMFEMVNNVKLNFQKDLTARVYKSKDIQMDELLLESPEILDERKKAFNRFDASHNALKLMREIEQICHMTNV